MEQPLEQPKQEPVEVKIGDGSNVQVETPPAEDNSSSDIHEGHTYEWFSVLTKRVQWWPEAGF